MKSDSRDRIRAIAIDRGIDFLLHFTQTANLPGIARYGLLPRRELEKSTYSAFASDKHRLDENPDAVSISVSRINELMLESKRRKSGHKDWIVLVLSPEILWTHDCKFCWRNAARKEIKEHRGWRGGPWAFAEMFFDRGVRTNQLPPYYPTDPEAEVQILEPIAPSYIIGIVVNDPRMLGYVRAVSEEFFDRDLSIEVGQY